MQYGRVTACHDCSKVFETYAAYSNSGVTCPGGEQDSDGHGVQVLFRPLPGWWMAPLTVEQVLAPGFRTDKFVYKCPKPELCPNNCGASGRPHTPAVCYWHSLGLARACPRLVAY